MKPVTYERDGVRVAVAVQVINKPACRGDHGPCEPGRSSELAASGLDGLEFLVRALGLLVRALGSTAVYLVGLCFALAFWSLGRVGEGLQAIEASMGGSRRQLVQGMLPPVFRNEHQLEQLPAPQRTWSSGHKMLEATNDDD